MKIKKIYETALLKTLDPIQKKLEEYNTTDVAGMQISEKDNIEVCDDRLPTDIDGGLSITAKKFKSFGAWKLNKVLGSLNIYKSSLTSLKGLENTQVTGMVHISSSELKNLEYCPTDFAWHLFVDNCPRLRSLEGLPKSMKQSLTLKNLILPDLTGAPSSVNALYIEDCKIGSIDGIPERIFGDLSFDDTMIMSLHDIHKKVKLINGSIYMQRTTITECVLGLLLIKGIKAVYVDNAKSDLRMVMHIINKYLKEPMSKQRMIDCQNELIDAGFEEYAQL
jgi:hypothetical protein